LESPPFIDFLPFYMTERFFWSVFFCVVTPPPPFDFFPQSIWGESPNLSFPGRALFGSLFLKSWKAHLRFFFFGYFFPFRTGFPFSPVGPYANSWYNTNTFCAILRSIPPPPRCCRTRCTPFLVKKTFHCRPSCSLPQSFFFFSFLRLPPPKKTICPVIPHW